LEVVVGSRTAAPDDPDALGRLCSGQRSTARTPDGHVEEQSLKPTQLVGILSPFSMTCLKWDRALKLIRLAAAPLEVWWLEGMACLKVRAKALLVSSVPTRLSQR
jgi:hypothetical protein